MGKDYEKIYEKIVDYEVHLHDKNQRKIKMGIKINIFVPLIFLMLSFVFPASHFLCYG